MKTFNSIGLTGLFILLYFQVAAFVIAPTPSSPVYPSLESQQTVEEFLAMSPEDYRVQTGKKMKWGQRLVLKLAQKQLKKKLKRGKIKADDPVKSKKKNLSALSMIFGLVSILALIIGVGSASFSSSLATITLVIAILGLILGIFGLAREKARGMATTGIITGGIVSLLLTIVFLITSSLS